ncbi:hypothetical protein CHS0354_033461 [Potamilus streckersoni]|uniref:Uncharacterized protein n=1 Tax=Potamilus streckersoni TaxID=2493646 RepID=A0AAE0SGH3_9BIVA|nr:hypothetical protein CHS0354_033461 [Potamilus streckersoni]
MENQVNENMIVEMGEKNREIKVIHVDCHEQVITDKLDSGPFCRKDDLESTRTVIRQLQAALCEQQVRSNQIIMSLKLKLYKSQQAQKNQRLEAEKQMHEVMSSMLCLEAQLRRDHRSVCMVLRQRDQEILVQRNHIKKLSEQNEQLLNAIKEIYAQGGMNGYLRDHSQRNGVNSSDSPMHRNSTDKEDKCERGGKEEKEDKYDKWDKHYKPDKHKGKFSSVKDMLRRHRSSLELNSAELEKGFQYSRFKFGSQENINQSSESFDRIGKFRNRSQTVSGYPENISGFLEESVKEDNSSNSGDTSKMSVSPHSARFTDVIDEEDTVGSFIHHHGNITSVASMPMLATIQEDCYDKHLRAKERPHSMSSVDLIAIHKQVETLTCSDSSPTTPLSPDPPLTPPPPPSPSYTHTSSESNTFKLFKTMFRRKGSKIKNKKRSVSLSQNTDQEYDEALKKHFEKYDMS